MHRQNSSVSLMYIILISPPPKHETVRAHRSGRAGLHDRFHHVHESVAVHGDRGDIGAAPVPAVPGARPAPSDCGEFGESRHRHYHAQGLDRTGRRGVVN